jgi:putative phage-type endonuclease
MKSEDFRESRRKGLGGTDIAAIMGINPHKTAYEVYLEKVEGYGKDLSDNKAVRRGNIFEAPTAELYELETGKKTYCTGTVTHKEYPFFIANPDRIIPEESRGVEIKTVGYYSKKEWGESGSKMIPEHYYMQIAHYMFVLDYQYWDVAALFPDYEIRIYSFERNSHIDEMISQWGKPFWKNHVEARNAPEIDFKSPGSKELIKSLYKEVNQETVELSDELFQEKIILEQAKKLMKANKEFIDSFETQILNAMGNAEVGVFSNGDRFVRKLIKRGEYTVKESEYVKLDYKPFKEESSKEIV